MQDNEIYTFKLDFFQAEQSIPKPKLGLTHKLLKNPSFAELNKMINEYPSSPPSTLQSTRPVSRAVSGPTLHTSRSKSRIRSVTDETAKECTFQPKINYLKGKENSQMDLQQKIQILAKPKTETIEKREKMKRKLEVEEGNKFSYAPEINKYEGKPRKNRESKGKNWAVREKIRKEEEEMEKCTFKPQIIKKKSLEKPIYQRVEAIQVEKMRNLQRIKRNSESGLVFQPEINKKSRRMSTTRRSESKISSACESDREITEEIENFSLPKREFHNFNDFYKRQHEFLSKKQEKLSINQCEYNFKPNINRNSMIIVESSNSPKPLLEKLKKLSENNLEKLKSQKEIRENFYSQFSHSPEINNYSKNIGKPTDFNNLVENLSKKTMREKKQEGIFKEVMENCTFSPDIVSRKVKNVNSSYGQTERILQNIEKQAKIKRERSKIIKNMQDYEELKKCSFKPIINEKILLSASNTGEIKGLDRYFELKSMAKRMSKEKLSREAEIFFTQPRK